MSFTQNLTVHASCPGKIYIPTITPRISPWISDDVGVGCIPNCDHSMVNWISLITGDCSRGITTPASWCYGYCNWSVLKQIYQLAVSNRIVGFSLSFGCHTICTTDRPTSECGSCVWILAFFRAQWTYSIKTILYEATITSITWCAFPKKLLGKVYRNWFRSSFH